MPEFSGILAPMTKRTQKQSDLREVNSLVTRAILLLDRNGCEEQVEDLLRFKVRMRLLKETKANSPSAIATHTQVKIGDE